MEETATIVELFPGAGPGDQGQNEGWTTDASGELPVYDGATIEGVESAWADLDAKEDALNWERGAIAHAISVRAVYGDNALGKFAGRMRVHLSTVLDWLATYRRMLNISDPERRGRVLRLNLRYSHYRACNGIADDALYEELLTKANDKGWLTGDLAEAAQAWIKALESERQPASLPGIDVEDAEEGEQPPRPQREAHDPNDRTRALLRAFLGWCEGSYHLTLVDLDAESDGYGTTQDVEQLIEEFLADEG